MTFRVNDRRIRRVTRSLLNYVKTGLPKDSLKEMRALIKRLSQKLLDDPYFTKGKPGMRAEIQDNLETYLTRAYKIYDSKNWKESVMRGDQEQVLNDAKNSPLPGS